MPHDQSLSHLDSLLARLLAAWPETRIPPASYALYREKLNHIPINTLAQAIETLVEKGGKRFPHVGEIIGLCRSTQESSCEDETPWGWAGLDYSSYEKLPASAREHWGDRWRARCEAKLRDQGRSCGVSYFDPEPLDDVLDRLSLDRYGNIIDTDPLGLGAPKRIEDHSQPDTRDSSSIIQDFANLMRLRMETAIGKNQDRNRERKAEREAARR